MAVPCPTCTATAGEPCRAVRSRRRSERYHEARMKAYNPRYKTENRALCCICGHLRTISYKRTFRYDDPAATRRRTTDSPVGTGE
ncbi:zinc finger domain-containing protein [Mycolicibacterium tokaiense]|uniref:zinc finger domain-containing protein n=1 Tax=Mycolicibacterium tokaiense TaxID=39695 RepID=UPI003F496DC2